MKLLKNCTVFEDDNGAQYSLGEKCKVHKVIELKDRIIIYYLDRRGVKNTRPVYCYSKKDGSLIWQIESLLVFKEEKFSEKSQVYIYNAYIKDSINGKSIHFTDPIYDGRYPEEEWDSVEKYLSLRKRMNIYNNKGELKESEENIILTHFTQEEKDTLLNGYDKSHLSYYKIEEFYSRDKYLILCASPKHVYFSLNPDTGKLTKIIEGVD
jgi:hypothetical protein